MPFPDPIVTGEGALIIDQLRSSNYAQEPAAGWQVTRDGDATFQQVVVRDQLTAVNASFDTINVGGTDLVEQINSASLGVILSGRLAQQTGMAITTTLTKIMEINCGTVQPGRNYRIQTLLLAGGTGTLALADKVTFTYRYTLDGSTPTVTSPQMDTGFVDNYYPLGHGNWLRCDITGDLDVAATGILRIGLCADVVAGAGAYSVYVGSSAISRPFMVFEDRGPSGKRNDAAVTLTGGGISRFVKTFNATWSYGADGSSTELFNSWGYVGGIDDFGCYVGFDSAAIVAGLAGSVTPVSLVARWRPRTRRTTSGLDARLGTHNLTSSAAAQAAVSNWPTFFRANLAAYGITLLSNVRANGLPNTSYDESLGTTVFGQFKAGTRKGLAYMGEPEMNSVGGEGSVYLDGTNQIQLIFTYDGTS